MKTEQAIKLLHRLQDEQFDGIHGDERREALEMAVKALEPNLGQKTIDCIIKRLNGEDTAQPTQTNADSTQSNTLDCVSRRMAIDAVADELKGIFVEYRDIAEKMIGKLPSAQPQRKKGNWILIKGSNGKDYHKCSECLHTQEITGVKNYCAVCGADMRGESE